MDEPKKSGTGPGSAAIAVSPGASPAAPATGAGVSIPGKQRKPRVPGDPENGTAIPKMRVRRDPDSQKFEAVKALTNLAEDGRFLLLYEVEGKTETVNCWN